MAGEGEEEGEDKGHCRVCQRICACPLPRLSRGLWGQKAWSYSSPQNKDRTSPFPPLIPLNIFLNSFASCSWSRCISHTHFPFIPVHSVHYIARCILKIYRPTV